MPETYLNFDVKESKIFTLKGFIFGYHDRVYSPAKFKDPREDYEYLGFF